MLLFAVDGDDHYDEADNWYDEFPVSNDGGHDDEETVPDRPRRPDDRPLRGQDGQFYVHRIFTFHMFQPLAMAVTGKYNFHCGGTVQLSGPPVRSRAPIHSLSPCFNSGLSYYQ